MATITIVNQPSQQLTPAYFPMPYEIQVVGDPTDYDAVIKIQPYLNGAAFGGVITIPPHTLEDAGSNTIHKFSFNLAERVQRYFDPGNFFLPVGLDYPDRSADYQAEVYIVVSFLYPDADGILQAVAGTATSTTFPVINGYRRGNEDADLSDYDVSAFTGSPTRIKWLTRKPVNSIICLDDSEYVTIWAKGLTAVRLRAYDSDGALQGEGVLFLDLSTYGANEVNCIPIGPANINAIDPGDWFSGSVEIDEDTRYYLVQAGWILGSNFSALTELRRYYVVPSYTRKHRVHFINSFGFQESLSIYNNRLIEYQTQSSTFTKPLQDAASLIDGGEVDLQKRGRYQISSPIGNLSREEQEWLAFEFAMSPRVMVQEGSNLIPFRIAAGTWPGLDDDDANPVLSFDLIRSRSEVSQRN